MKRFVVCSVCVLAGMVAGVVAQQATGKIPQLHTKQVLKEAVNVKMDGKEAEVTMLELTYDPGAKSPSHRHPAGPVFVYVIEGEIESGVNGEAPKVYKAGEGFVEQVGSVHSHSRNASADQPAKFLAVFLTEKGAATLTTLAQ